MLKNDTICAIITPPLMAAVGVIRLSGEDAVSITNRFFSKDLATQKSHTVRYGQILDEDGKPVDDVVVTCYRAPHSYTGEDVMEISCHGSVYVLHKVMRLFLNAGARQAGNGEFSKRAFLNGKMDIVQAESVIDLIEAESEQEAAVALRHMKGGLSKEIEKIRQELLGLAAQILAFIDYPDDEIGELSEAALNGGIQHALAALSALEQSFSVGNRIKSGLKVSIVGKPNVGKSRVMNRIVGYERSIVTDIAGTTRDIVEDTAVFGGWKLVLSDTAGIRETEDTVEKIGVQKTEESVSGADLLLCVFDGSRPADAEDDRVLAFLKQAKTAKIALVNKSDLKREFDASVLKGFETVLWVSAKENDGFSQLSDAVKTLFEKNGCGRNIEMITNERQYACVSAARQALQRALENAAMTADARLLDLEQAIEELSAFTGKSVSEQMVETIFSRFCVGK